MKTTGIFLMILSLPYVSCKSKTKSDILVSNGDTTKFFQVSDFFKAQIAEVNRIPYFIYEIIKTGSKQDSLVINTATFNEISSVFVTPDINNPDLKKYYKESIFHDQTTKSFTINYATGNKNLEIQNVDILLKEDGQTVKRIFIRKFFNYADSSIIEQLSWKPQQRFEVNSMVQKPGNSETLRQTIVIWNEKN